MNRIDFILALNRRDYRAWYGLAQASELLSMKENALYYYQNAVALKWVLTCESIHD